MGRRSATSAPSIIGVLDHTILENVHLQNYLYDLLILQPISAKRAVQYNLVLNPHITYPPTQPSSSTTLFQRLRASISQGWDCSHARGCGDDACDTCRYSCCSRSCCSLMLRFTRSLRRPLRQARMAPRETSTTANIAPVSIQTLPLGEILGVEEK